MPLNFIRYLYDKSHSLKTIITPLSTVTAEQANEISLLSHQLGYYATAVETLNNINQIISNKDNCIFVAVQNQKILGWIHGFYTVRVESDAFVEIAGLVVHEQCRKQQIGKKLIEAVGTWAQSFNVRRITVRCNEIRSESHRFYEHLGFVSKKNQLVFEIPAKSFNTAT